MSLIAKRFEHDVQPYTAEEISEECQIPIRLTHETLYELQEINLLHEVVTDEKSEDIAYQPSMDINLSLIHIYFLQILVKRSALSVSDTFCNFKLSHSY